MAELLRKARKPEERAFVQRGLRGWGWAINAELRFLADALRHEQADAAGVPGARARELASSESLRAPASPDAVAHFDAADDPRRPPITGVESSSTGGVFRIAAIPTRTVSYAEAAGVRAVTLGGTLSSFSVDAFPTRLVPGDVGGAIDRVKNFRSSRVVKSRPFLIC